MQTVPLLPVLKQRYPDAQISWVVNRELRDLVDGHPDLHESIPFDRRGGWSAWITLLRTLRQRRFDLVFDLQGLLRSAVMTTVTGASARIGLETAREGSRYTLNGMIPNSGRDIPAHARYWRLAEVLGLGHSPRQTQIVTSEQDQTWAIAQLKNLPRPIFAVHPGARWVTKRWPVEKFADLMVRADRQWSGSVLILGSKAERPDADQLMSLLLDKLGSSAAPRLKNLAGQSTLKQLTSLLERVDFAISNDSGPMHLAAGLDIPTLGLFTCTSAFRSGPPGSMHEMVSTQVACAAGYHKTCPHHGSEHLSCLRELGVARAWSGLQRLVDKNRSAQRVA